MFKTLTLAFGIFHKNNKKIVSLLGIFEGIRGVGLNVYEDLSVGKAELGFSFLA